MKVKRIVLIISVWAVTLVITSGLTLFIATRPSKTKHINIGDYLHPTGRYCAWIVEEERDWRNLPSLLWVKHGLEDSWHASLFVGRDCETNLSEGVWTDLGWNWHEDAVSQITNKWTDEGFTVIRRDGRSVFIPSRLYLQKTTK